MTRRRLKLSPFGRDCAPERQVPGAQNGTSRGIREAPESAICASADSTCKGQLVTIRERSHRAVSRPVAGGSEGIGARQLHSPRPLKHAATAVAN